MPTGTAKEIVFVKCPGLDSTPGGPDDIMVDDLLDLAEAYVNVNIFSKKYNLALALVVCHQITLAAQGGGSSTSSGSGAVGGIKSEKEGDLARSFGNMLNNDNISANKLYWMQTPAGQELMALWDACILMPRNRFVNGR